MSRMLVFATIAFLCGCSARQTPSDMVPVLCECFSDAAYAAVKSGPAAPAPAPVKKCCGTCGRDGLPPGKVRSGDDISVVDCPCDPDCKCRQKSGYATSASPRALR